ncbi:MAG: LysR family transcriptional regulator [Comamonas sp.]
MNQNTAASATPTGQAAPGWELWRSFLAVVQQGSLSGAARELGLTQPSVSRHIQVLELRLGAALFTRSHHGLKPTPLAQSLVPQAQAMASAAAHLLRSASAPQAHTSGTVRVTASEVIGTLVLPPMLAAFRQAHPAITVELELTNHNQDLLQREADIAIRMLRPTQTALVARHVGDVRVGLFANRQYVADHGLPQDMDTLLKHPLIGVDRDEKPLAHPALRQLGLDKAKFAYRCDSDVAQLMLLKAGVGIGACHLPLAAADPECVAVLPGAVSWSYEIWLAMHEDQRNTQRIRLLFNHLANGLLAYTKEK